MKTKKQEERDEKQGSEPPKPMKSSGAGHAGVEFLPHEFFVIKMRVRQVQPGGSRRFGPSGFFIGPAFGAGLRCRG